MARPICFEAPGDTEATQNIYPSKGGLTTRDNRRQNEPIRELPGNGPLDQQDGAARYNGLLLSKQ